MKWARSVRPELFFCVNKTPHREIYASTEKSYRGIDRDEARDCNRRLEKMLSVSMITSQAASSRHGTWWSRGILQQRRQIIFSFKKRGEILPESGLLTRRLVYLNSSQNLFPSFFSSSLASVPARKYDSACWSIGKQPTQWQPIFSNFASISGLILCRRRSLLRSINFEGFADKGVKICWWFSGDCRWTAGIFIDFHLRIRQAGESEMKASKRSCHKFYCVIH